MKIASGCPATLGSRWDGEGTYFGVYSSAAQQVDLCLFRSDGRETNRLPMPECTDGVWHGFVPACGPGQHYGFRARGTFNPEAGLWFNENKLLLDPYARELSGEAIWSPALFAYEEQGPDGALKPDQRDSAPFVPRAVVQGKATTRPTRHHIPWKDTIVYEAHLRGLTRQFPDLTDVELGTLRGLKNKQVLQYLTALGITSLELLPVQAILDEHFLQKKQLRNYWGYNTLAFFAPAPRYLAGAGTDDFREVVNALHDAGLEVILDVVYNHTAEGDRLGPTLNFRGLDNHAYYRLLPDEPQRYVNDTGTGNTINADHPMVQRLILDSLAYWALDMGIDGFRFDLASILGRHSTGFSTRHPLLESVGNEPRLRNVKLIAEPWDVGPGGYQLGQFPAPWSEWNDKYRDAIRAFWLRGENNAAEFARRLHGSADVFEPSKRGPGASVNLITAHDGFTLQDLVSYEQRHNQANGEDNRDGHQHNLSCNHGHEGPTDDPGVVELRHRQRLNLLATLLLSQGTPMILAGDEFGNTQAGNNNAYCQDNKLGWLDWHAAARESAFSERVKQLLRLRLSEPLLRQDRYLHGEAVNRSGDKNIQWLGSDGSELQASQWSDLRAITMVLRACKGDDHDTRALALCCNGLAVAAKFHLPENDLEGDWECLFYSADEPEPENFSRSGPFALGSLSVALFANRTGQC